MRTNVSALGAYCCRCCLTRLDVLVETEQIRGIVSIGACHLGLSQVDFSKGRDRPKGVGFRIWCDTAQDVDTIAARLRAFGGTIVEEPGDHWDTYSFTAQDPDGFKITITKAKTQG